VEQAQAQLREAYGILDAQIGSRQWAMGDSFSIVDCAAAPALSYATTLVRFDSEHSNLPGYLDRLIARPSFARVLKEAEPYFKFDPNEVKPRTVPG
jgi:glutathione S-transferase